MLKYWELNKFNDFKDVLKVEGFSVDVVKMKVGSRIVVCLYCFSTIGSWFLPTFLSGFEIFSVEDDVLSVKAVGRWKKRVPLVWSSKIVVSVVEPFDRNDVGDEANEVLVKTNCPPGPLLLPPSANTFFRLISTVITVLDIFTRRVINWCRLSNRQSLGFPGFWFVWMCYDCMRFCIICMLGHIRNYNIIIVRISVRFRYLGQLFVKPK